MSGDIMSQCHFSYMDESIPICLEDLGAEMGYDWRGYLNVCTSALLKEVKDKFVYYRLITSRSRTLNIIVL